MDKNRYKKLGKNTALMVVGNFASKILTFILLPLYTYCLTTSEYGISDLITTTINLCLPFLTLTISESVLRFTLDKNSDKGISLIMLVVTIIIMVILAGITINTTIESGVVDRAEDLHIRTEFSELAEEWNTRRAELQMKGISDEDMNYPDLKSATIQVGETTLQEKLIRATKLSDDMNDKIQVKKGRLVYSKDDCTQEEIDYFDGEGLKEVSEVE